MMLFTVPQTFILQFFHVFKNYIFKLQEFRFSQFKSFHFRNFERSEQGIRELDIKYGKVCHKLSYNIVNDKPVSVSKGGVVQEPDRTITLQRDNEAWEVISEGY